jgi:tetratricopeptide (TPR) repeat protein
VISSSDRARVLAIRTLLVLTTLAAYSGVIRNGFTSFDDDVYITANEHVSSGLSREGLAWAFTTGHGANWHPLTWLSHMLDCELFGLHAAGHHLVSLALHVATALLLFHFFLRTTAAIWASAFVAAVFALHPQHVESVAWAAERKDVLCAFFWVLALIAYVRWVDEPKASRYALVVALFVLGLLAKPMIVTLPFTLFLLDVWPLRRAGGPFLREKIPLFLLAAGSSVVTFLVQRAGGAMARGEAIPFLLRAESAVVAWVAYVAKAAWPTDLAAYYPHAFAALPPLEVAGAALLLAAATAATLRGARTRPWLAVGWLWFLGTLVPVIGLVQVGLQSMADRYTYVPMIGLSILVAFSAREIAARSERSRALCAVLFAVAACTWTALTWRQVGFWKDDASLVAIARGRMRDTYAAHAAIGRAFLQQGRWEEAAAELRRAVEIDPSVAQSHSDLGMALEELNRSDEAIAEYREALRRSPDLHEALYNLGGALAERGRWDEAIEQYERALAMRPDQAQTHCELGLALLQRGSTEAGIRELRRAVELDPGQEKARRALAQRGL